MIRWFAVTLAALLLAAVPAQAGWRINRATAIAGEVWGPAPCETRLVVASPPADWYEDATPWGWFDACVAYVTVAAKRRGWLTFCDSALHEWGHIYGYGHTYRGHQGVMLDRAITRDVLTLPDGERRVRWGGIHPACLHRGRPFLERHGLLRNGRLTRRRASTGS